MGGLDYRKCAFEIMPGPATKRVESTKIICELQKCREFPRYSEVDFKPYVGDQDPCSCEVFNTFSGFVLETYTPTVAIDVRKTATWYYLCVVFGHSTEYNSRVGELPGNFKT